MFAHGLLRCILNSGAARRRLKLTKFTYSNHSMPFGALFFAFGTWALTRHQHDTMEVVVEFSGPHRNVLYLESVFFQTAGPPVAARTASAGIDEEGGMLGEKRLKLINRKIRVLAQYCQLPVRRIIAGKADGLRCIEHRDESLPPSRVAVMLELQEIVGIRNDDRQIRMAPSGHEVLHKPRGGDKPAVIGRPELTLLRNDQIEQ